MGTTHRARSQRMGAVSNFLYVTFFASFFITCVASAEYWAFWTTSTICFFFMLLVSLLQRVLVDVRGDLRKMGRVEVNAASRNDEGTVNEPAAQGGCSQ